MKQLAGRVAIVTGAAGGIGGALVRRLADEGCRLALVDVDPQRLDALATALESAETSTHRLDVADAAAWAELAEEVQGIHGGAHLLVNAAGITVHGLFADQSLDDVDRVVDVNLKGVLYGCRAFLPLLLAEPEAHIVNVSSFAGFVAFPFQSTYSASKFAVRGFSAALRMEVAARGVGVTAVLPGTTATPFLERARSYDPEASTWMARAMLDRGVPPERLADRIVRAVRRDRAELVVGWDAVLTSWVRWFAPWAPRVVLQYLVGRYAPEQRRKRLP